MTATISDSAPGRPHSFYRELSDQHLGALWNVLSNTLTREPAVRSVPQLWRWRDLRPRMLHSGELVTAAVLPTMSSYLQLIPRDEHTRAHRHVASTVYHVAEGGGSSIIAGRHFDWEVGDTFVVPAWAWHEHASSQGDAVLFSFSNRPVLHLRPGARGGAG